jgi:DNA-binding GntR family transcriptional regulator
MAIDDRRGPRDGSLRYRTAQAAVADMLRRQILAGEIAPGTRLLQTDVAERFQTSTTPVREALRQLVAEGLLDGDPHRGVTVHETNLKELEEVYEIRLVLEPLCIAATVENIGDDDLGYAEELVDQMEAESDPGAWTALNAEFHRVLTEAADRPRLAAIIHNLRNISAIYIAASIQELPDRIKAGNVEHRELLAACRTRDVAKAQLLERNHLEHTLEIGKKTIGAE